MRILIVEDDKDLNRQLSDAMASAGYVVDSAFDGEEGHHLGDTEPYDAVILDIGLPLMDGILAVPVLFLASLAVAIVVSPTFLGVLLGYFALTTAYSLVLKRKMLIDAVALALLYAFRVVGGAVAINVAISEWLIAFSLFIFMALALVKRYIELSSLLDRSLPDPSNRNYKTGDLPIVAALAAASGFNAVTILTLYLSSDAVHSLYNHPQLLWLLCPVLMFWFGRVLLMAHRRLMHDDPIVFALRDRVSLHVLLASVGIVLAATF